LNEPTEILFLNDFFIEIIVKYQLKGIAIWID